MEEDLKTLLQYREKESKVFMPNEIFDDIKKPFIQMAANKKIEQSNNFIKVETVKGIRKKRGQNKDAISKHIAFAYSYYYLISWLYRNAKYGEINITIEDIKKVLTYTRKSQEVDYIIKKNGILDEIGYTETTNDYPIAWEFKDPELEFIFFSDMDKDIQKMLINQKGRNFKIKIPIKHLHRDSESYKEGILDGLFYEPHNFHVVPFEIFLFCMGKKEVGVRGFYLYCYLKRMNEYYGEGYDVSIEKLSKEIAIPISTLEKDIEAIRCYRMVNCIHNQEYFVPGLEDGERKANTYITNEYFAFSDIKLPIKKIQRMNLNDYRIMKQATEEAPNVQQIDDMMWGLSSNM
ncbi:hypothetical protein [Cytobacillus sp. FSL H8-0458]|uniref:hypothetical protein n=1 Tax=Cytobacillus sp. FSL H8-0458 TaxID=2975346 RepID=UPI0030F70658